MIIADADWTGWEAESAIYTLIEFDFKVEQPICVASQKRRDKMEIQLEKCSPELKKEFMNAMVKEVANWTGNHAVRGHPRSEITKGATMRMRWVLTIKADGTAKARLVILGFTDRDLATLKSAAPTASRHARSLQLLMAAKMDWTFQKRDVRAASLQGKPTEELRNVFVEPTAELREIMNLGDEDILQLLKPGYGTVRAPRQWWMTVKEDLATVDKLVPMQLEPWNL